MPLEVLNYGNMSERGTVMDKMNLFTELSEDDKLRQADKEFFIQYNHVECGGDKSIVEFIANF